MHLHLFCFHCVPMLQCPILVQKNPSLLFFNLASSRLAFKLEEGEKARRSKGNNKSGAGGAKKGGEHFLFQKKSTRRNKLLLITMHLHLFCFHCVPMLQCPILVQKTPIISLITIHPFNDNNDNYVLDCSFQREKASLKSSKCLI